MLWLLMHTVAGYMLVIQKTTTHHGPELYHAGDELREERDWGLHTLDTTRDMDKSSQVYGALARPLVYTTFGNHLLHHFFPAVDHSKVLQTERILIKSNPSNISEMSFLFNSNNDFLW